MKKMNRIERLKIMLYIPNIIGYIRYILFLKSMYHAFNPTEWQLFIMYYYIAIFLDAIDGETARICNQCSRLGCCLDMVCDRVSVSVIYFILAREYPEYDYLLFLFFIVDYGGHFL